MTSDPDRPPLDVGDPGEARSRLPLLALALVGVLIVAAAVGFVLLNRSPDTPDTPASGGSGSASGGIEGLASFSDLGREHVEGTVSYPQSPPVGGDHASVWQNCGWYDDEVANELGVHSMEHGAVWVTYLPDLPAADLERLQGELSGKDYVLASPYPGLPGPVVASAWGKQVVLDSVDDPRLAAFVTAFAGTDNAPEPGAACTDGIGTPSG